MELGSSLLYHAVHATVFSRIALWPSMLTDDATVRYLTHTCTCKYRGAAACTQTQGILITRIFSLWQNSKQDIGGRRGHSLDMLPIALPTLKQFRIDHPHSCDYYLIKVKSLLKSYRASWSTVKVSCIQHYLRLPLYMHWHSNKEGAYYNRCAC